MSINLMYPHEKFLTGVDVMATSDTSLRERIESAWMSFHPLMERDFEGELGDKFRELKSALTKSGPVYGGDGAVVVGSVNNTLNHATDEELRAIADMIFSMFVGVAREYYGSLGARA